jgi:uncharacterized protein with von Willebrand factor type A (vWA) domain
MSATPDPVTMTMMSATDALQTCTEACAGWQQEIAHFVDLRLAENRRSWEALMSACDVAGMMKAQQEWGLRAAADYTREATRLAKFLTTVSLTGMTPAVQEAARLVA